MGNLILIKDCLFCSNFITTLSLFLTKIPQSSKAIFAVFEETIKHKTPSSCMKNDFPVQITIFVV